MKWLSNILMMHMNLSDSAILDINNFYIAVLSPELVKEKP